ncbi:MFS transporter [Penicillium sp. IBT 35674x]|nr:MFS transporter [Penicillium sp. IBT 35674x]
MTGATFGSPEDGKAGSFIYMESSNTEPPVNLVDEEASNPTDSPFSSPRNSCNWPEWKKNTYILVVSFHSMSSTFMAAGIIPAFSTFAETYHVSLTQASYLVSVQILLLGIAPIFWNVITQRYGRRHVLIFSVLGSMICNIGGARCTTYAGQMTTRALTAAIISPPIGIGSGVVTEFCSPDQRARKLGWWVLMTILGTPSGPLIMGFVVQHAGVQWIFWTYTITNFLQAVAYLPYNEETCYGLENDCHGFNTPGLGRFFKGLLPKRRGTHPVKAMDFFSPLMLVCEPRILIAALTTAITFCYGNIVFVVEMPISFGEKFGLNSQQTGLQFISVIVGCLIGEQLSGPMSDLFMKALEKRRGQVIPANRLWLTYIGFLTIIVGLLVWGFQLQQAQSWNITPCVGVAIASFGNQIQSTTLIAYAVDSHKDKSSAIGVFFNVTRLVYGFVSVLVPFLLRLFADYCS